MKKHYFNLIKITVIILLFASAINHVSAATTYTVTTNADGGAGSLRAGINTADIIVFRIGGGGAATINLLSALPAITVPVTIDGTTQPGFAGTPLIELNGTGALGAHGINISATGGGSTIKGLIINRFPGNGINIGPSSHNNTIIGNYIGTNAAGTSAQPNFSGIYIGNNAGASNNNVIGGTTAAERNVISGNSDAGVYVYYYCNNTKIQGNYIGTNAAGTAAIPNARGIYLNEVKYTLIGGNIAAAGNVISGNTGNGIWWDNGTLDPNNKHGPVSVKGNKIGTDVTGNIAIPNFNGIRFVYGGAVIVALLCTDTIGGASAGERNIISGNTNNGIYLNCWGTVVTGNYIGTNGTATAAVPNNSDGVGISCCGGIRIGAAVAWGANGAPNIISGNGGNGINGGATIIAGNYIGTDVTGTLAIGNTLSGINAGGWIGSTAATFGGTDNAVFRNIISGNGEHGITMCSGPVLNNYIGTQVNGTAALPNGKNGIDTPAGGGVIGGTGTAEGNVISGNNWNGIYLPAGTNNVTIQGNFIGANISATAGIGNALDGIRIESSTNSIGGTSNNKRNIIAYNTQSGVNVIGAGATSNLIARNLIYLNGSTFKPINLNGVANANWTPPTITLVTPGTVSGTVPVANAGDSVEVFSSIATADPNCINAEVYLGSVKADGSGAWSLTGLSLTGQVVKATARKNGGTNTSEFSSCASVPVFVTSVTICSGNTTVLTAGGADSYTWQPSTGLSSTTGSMVMANPLSTTSYTVTGYIGSNYGYGFLTVTVKSTPTLITTPSSVICFGDTIVLGVVGASSYTWYPSTGLNTATGNIVNASPGATTTYSITGTNSNGCISTYSVNVSVNPLPSLYTTGNITICFGNNVTLSASGNAGSYSWMPGTFLNSTSGASVLVSPTLIGVYTYSLIATDLVTTCISKSNMTITVLPNPVVVASTDVGICPGISTNLSAMSNAASIVWTPTTGLNNNTSNNVTASPTITTIYTVTGTDVYGCTTSDAVTVTVSPVLIANAGNDVSICSGSSTTLTASGGSTYLWSPTESLNIIAVYAIASPTTTTTYTLNIIDPCPTVPDYITITVFYLPTITVSSNVTICEGSSTLPLLVSGAVTYKWNPSATVNSDFEASPLSTTTYTVTGTDANGCSNYNTIIVDVDPFSPVNAGPDVTITLGETVTLSPTIIAGATYSWSPSDYLSCTDCQNPVASPPNTIVYVLTVNEGVCSSTDSIIVYVKCNDIFVLTAFSPNGDLFNDVLYLKSVCIKTLISFAIYDRWGEKVFETSDITKGWDGKLGNTEMSTQVFVYLIKGTGTNDEEITKKGNVSLIK